MYVTFGVGTVLYEVQLVMGVDWTSDRGMEVLHSIIGVDKSRELCKADWDIIHSLINYSPLQSTPGSQPYGSCKAMLYTRPYLLQSLYVFHQRNLNFW